MAACSDAGVTWVCETSSSRTFAKSAERFMRSMDQRLRTSPSLFLTMERREPTEVTAWDYVTCECSQLQAQPMSRNPS